MRLRWPVWHDRYDDIWVLQKPWRRKYKPARWAADQVCHGARLNYVVMDEYISMLDADMSQFGSMLAAVTKRLSDDVKYEWLEDELFPSFPDPRVWSDWVWVD